MVRGVNKQEWGRTILKFQVSVSLGYVNVFMWACMLMCMFGVYVCMGEKKENMWAEKWSGELGLEKEKLNSDVKAVNTMINSVCVCVCFNRRDN